MRRLLNMPMKLNVRNSSLLLCGLLLTAGLAGSAVAQEGDTQYHGVTTVGEKAVTRTTADIMKNPNAISADRFLKSILKSTEEESDREDLPMNPGSPPVAQWPPAGSVNPGNGSGKDHNGRYNPQTIGLQWTGDTGNNLFPPDSFGAVGPDQILVTTNNRVRVYNKTGAAGFLNSTLDSFFSTVRNGSGTSDPRATYDPIWKRWFVLAINVSSPNRILLAVSDDDQLDAGTVWRFFFVQIAGEFCDYPSLGVDANGVYVGENTFNTALTSYLGTRLTVIQKSSVAGVGPIVSTRFTTATAAGEGPHSPRGVDNDDPAPANGYIIGASNIAFGRLVVRKVTGANTVAPTLGANLLITVPTTANPITPVPSNGASIDALDDRTFHAQMHRNRKTGARTLWVAHNIRMTSAGVGSAAGDRDGARWYEVDPIPAAPTLLQSGTSVDQAGAGFDHRTIPSCAMSGQGHMAIGFTMTRSGQLIRIGAAGKLFGTAPPLNTEAATLAFTSPATYNPGLSRWGDYSMTVVDPRDDQTLWTIQEYGVNNSTWGVRVVQLLAPPPSPISSVVPNVLNQGNNYNIVVTGTATAGSEYYDTDASYLNRLVATFSAAGVTVNSIAPFNHGTPQTFTMNVTVAAAAAVGPRNLTVTNPDGQSTTLNNAITVQANNPPVTLAPISTSIGLGQIISGNNASLAADDANPLKICKAFVPNVGSPRIRFDSDFLSPYLTATTLKLDLKARMTTGGAFAVRAFLADVSGTDSFTYGAANQVIADTAIALSFANYSSGAIAPGTHIDTDADSITDGTVRARVEIQQTGFSAVAVPCSEFELLNLTVTP